MSLIQKKDEEHDYIEGVEIIGSSDGPRDIDAATVDLIGGPSAEDIAADAQRDAQAAQGASGDAATAQGEPAQSAGDGSSDKGDGAPDDGRGSAPSSDPGTDGKEAPATDAPASDPSKEKEGADGGKPSKRMPLLAAIAVILVIMAGIGGYAFGSGAFDGAKGLSSATLTDDQLDGVVASYTYNGARHDVTAREALESQYSLDSIKSDDDTYAAPTAETTVAYIRRQILLADAASRGIEVSDDEISDYAQSTLGTDDFSSIADMYSLTEDQAKEVTRQSLMINKLQEQIVPDIADLTAPAQPTAPADGSEDAASADYGSYIIGLLGDEWDSSTGTWARTDGPYYEALGSETFSADSATYSQATTAYYVAYQQYQSKMSDLQSTWLEYANGLYNDCDVSLYGLYQ